MAQPSLLLSRYFWKCLVALTLPNILLAIVVVQRASSRGPLPPEQNRDWMLAALGVIWTVVVTVIGIWLSRRISHIAHQVHVSSEAMERGDFTRGVLGLGRDEVAAAAVAFNRMREALGGQISRLRDNRDRMETVLGGMIEGVLAVDEQQRVLLANNACRALFGSSPQNAVGRPLLEVVRSLDVQETIRLAFSVDEPASREIEVVGVRRRMVRVLARRLPGSPCPGVVVVFHDVTELRRLENLRRDFVANVSHELKTPLASIRAYAETLRLGAIHDQEHNLAFVERIEEQAARLDALILDLLHLARVETSTQAFEFSAVSLRQVCEETRQHHLAAAGAAGVDIVLASSTPDAMVWVDPEGVRVIADNLVSNAIKYTPSGGSVTLNWDLTAKMAVLTVTDTGIGIAEQDQQRVFERFYRVDKARSRALGGTGLGLSIVKHLTLAFGGEIGLSSTLGRGSSFRVSLPLATR